jgi:enamine deaminase RidA (YjgF/YER057c/UK114 family)
VSHEARLASLGITLPAPPPPVATYVNAVRSGDLLFLAGKGPLADAGRRPSGRVGIEYSVEEGYRLARSAGLALLSVLRAELGSLDRVRRIVKVLGMVAAPPEFVDHPAVINGCSDLLVEVFGEAGRHARSAVGMSSLPLGMPIEIELVAEIE